MTSHPSVCRLGRTSNSGWNVAPRQIHEWLFLKFPIVPAETQVGLAHTMLSQHLQLHLTEENDHQVRPSGPPSPKGLRPGIQDLATICPKFTSSSSKIPLVTRSSRLSIPGQWDHLFFEVNVWISLMRLEIEKEHSYSTKRSLNRQSSNSKRGKAVCFRCATLY